MVNADRISEVYKGQIWDGAPRQRARARIDWLVGHARGRVLDIGCSQGIAAILAARSEGTDLVVGIDVEFDRVVYALDDRATEPADVTARLGFLAASGAAIPFADDSFDTVLLGEVLEHLAKPDDVLREVARVLRPDGVAAITVPFGLSPHHDHRRTFYPADLLALVGSHLTPRSADLVDRYLRVTATGGDGDPVRCAQLLATVQPVADRELLAVEQAELAARGTRRELERRTHALAEQSRALTASEREVARLRRALQRAQERAARMRTRQDELAFQRDTYRWQLARLRGRRAVRSLVAIRAALGDPRALLALPGMLVRIAAGSPPPSPPPPQRPVARAEQPERPESADPAPPSTTAALHGATADRLAGLELRMRMLAPPPPVALRDLRVAGVLDEFSESSFAPECDLVTFRPDNWEEVLTSQPPHLLFVESAWKGRGGAWQYQVGTYHHAAAVGLPYLTALVGWCRQRGIPTVFWNKEDPVHFAKFSQAAQLFDVVLTSDADCVARYRGLPRLRAHAVDALLFAAQPRIHHPVTLDERTATCAFGGTYYRNRHPERRAQLETLLDAAAASGLVIFDRTFGQPSRDTGFPERFASYVRGGLAYDEMVAEYRRHRVFLNANSVVGSPTMFSRRVFELLACGTPIVSTPSVGMEALFGDIVLSAGDPQTARQAVTRLLTDVADWRARSAAGLRRVHGQHTYAHRLSALAGVAGYDVPPFGDERIAVLMLDDEVGAPDLDGVAAQSHRPHELLLGTHRDLHPAGATVVRQDAGRPRERRFADLAEQTDAPWVLVVAPDHALDLDGLADLAVARRWTDADVIGAAPGGTVTHRYVDRVAGHAALVRRGLVAAHGWDDRGVAPQARMRALGATCYAARP